MKLVQAACVLVTLSWLVPAQASELTHRIGDDESLEAIARAYYGSSWKAVYLRSRNGLGENPNDLAGKRIVIPASWMYKVRRGDSAARFPGTAS